MDRENIRETWSRLSASVDAWCDGRPVDALERDWVLGKLRDVYEAIRFSGSADEEAAVRTEPVAVESLTGQKPEDSVAESADLDLSGMLALEPELAPAASEELVVPTDAPNPAEPEVLVPPVEHRKEPEPAMRAAVSSPEPEPISAPVAAFVPQPQPETLSTEPEPLAVSRVEVLAKPRSETAPAEQTATLFAAEEATEAADVAEAVEMAEVAEAAEAEEEDDTTRHRRKQRVILSLYGDSKAARTADSGEERGMFEEVTVKTVASDDPIWASGASAVSPQPVAPSPEPVPPTASASASVGNVLGEVINHDVRTLSDTIEPPRDMASSLRRKSAISDLRQAIGINDKFLLIRDLFDGDSEAYEAAMQTLNDAGTLDDCMIYLTENYAWNADSDGVRLLMDLLERKFA